MKILSWRQRKPLAPVIAEHQSEPLRFDRNEIWRKQAYTARVLLIAFVISMGLNLCQSGIIIALFPLKETKPLLVQFSPHSQQVVHIEPMERHTKAYALSVQSYLRQYIEWREAIDLISEKERWTKVAYVSSEAVQEEFIKLNDHKNDKSPLNLRRHDRVLRLVNVVAVDQISDDLYHVVWEASDCRLGETIPFHREKWLSKLRLRFNDIQQITSSQDQYLNPLGIEIVDYIALPQERPVDTELRTPLVETPDA